ncbi:PTS glucitol/sorbitol transporter subunit IIA, partial [Klebsiella pneumoniae]|uniref:PTS glucitol/sorbitol transporter subunit IIA n=1 Tax=Klebsiella pneumoniae TaxID=573 RepID=UPI003532469C
KACVLPENPASYRVVRTKSYLFNKALGHITLNFDGADIAELPGTVHLYGEPPQIIQPGDQISFYPNCH